MLEKIEGHYVNCSLLSENSVVIDAGACAGDFLKKIGNYKITAIECNPINFNKLSKLKMPNVEFIHAALVGNSLKEVECFVYNRNKQGKDKWSNIFNLYKDHPSIKNFESLGTVPTITLNDLIEKHGCLDYVKMDVEGAEYDVVMSTNWSKIGQVSFEYHTLSVSDKKNKGAYAEKNKDYEEICNRLESFNFKLSHFENNEVYGENQKYNCN